MGKSGLVNGGWVLFHGCCAKHPLGLIPASVRWVSLVWLWELLSEPGQAMWLLIPKVLGFPNTHSSLRSAQILPVIPISDGRIKFGV